MPLIELSRDQLRAIQAAFLDAFPTEASFKIVVTLAGWKFDQVSSPGMPLPTRVMQTVGHAQSVNGLFTLLDSAIDSNPADLALQRFREELKVTAPPPDLNPFYMCRLGGGTVMVDRTPLREAVEDMTEQKGRRIFVITGASWSGKSHSLQLITFIAQVFERFIVTDLDLDPQRDEQRRRVITARDLASRLLTLCQYQIALPEDPSDLQWSKWITTFGDSFVGAAGHDAKARWIVIDSLNRVMLDQSAVDLINDLAIRVFTVLTNIRLVLVGYEQSLPSAVLPYIHEEKVERISSDHLVQFFVLAYHELKQPLDRGALTDAVARILNQVDMTSTDYLVKLAPLVVQEVTKIKRGGR